MEKITIRKGNIKDLKDIQTLNDELFKFEMTNKFDSYIIDWSFSEKSTNYFIYIIEKQIALIAEIEGKIVGYLAGSINCGDSHSCYEGISAELENMYISENSRHLGIGSKLINEFTNICKENDVSQIFVTATIGNVNAISFYHKNGFNDINLTLRKKL